MAGTFRFVKSSENAQRGKTRFPLMRLIVTLGLIFALAACDSSGAVLVATPIPPDSGFRTYRHAGGVFSLRLPPDWAIRDVSAGGVTHVEFSPPGNQGLPLSVYIVNTGQPITTPGLLDYLNRYMSATHGDPNVYQEVGRSAQGDGSWRVVGIQQTGIGPRQMNTFIGATGSFFSAIEADITGLDDAQLMTLRAVINTLRIDPNASAAIGDPAAPEGAAGGEGTVTFSALNTWISPAGDFVIAGLVQNNANAPLEAIRVTARFYDAAGAVLAEQGNVVPAEVLPVGLSAPFSVRFRGGRPAKAVRYELSAAARHAEYALPNHLGEAAFIRGNEVAKYNAAGFLTVSGDLVNQTQGPAAAVKVIVAVLDSQGRVVATDSAFLPKNPLMPGEVGRFEITFPELGGAAIGYQILIEGRKG